MGMMEASQASLRMVWGEDLVVQGVSGAADGVGEGVELDGDDDLGFAGGGCGAPGAGGAAADLDEGFGAASLGRAKVTSPVGLAGSWCG
jgi:hypothetical protein